MNFRWYRKPKPKTPNLEDLTFDAISGAPKAPSPVQNKTHRVRLAPPAESKVVKTYSTIVDTPPGLPRGYFVPNTDVFKQHSLVIIGEERLNDGREVYVLMDALQDDALQIFIEKSALDLHFTHFE